LANVQQRVKSITIYSKETSEENCPREKTVGGNRLRIIDRVERKLLDTSEGMDENQKRGQGEGGVTDIKKKLRSQNQNTSLVCQSKRRGGGGDWMRKDGNNAFSGSLRRGMEDEGNVKGVLRGSNHQPGPFLRKNENGTSESTKKYHRGGFSIPGGSCKDCYSHISTGSNPSTSVQYKRSTRKTWHKKGKAVPENAFTRQFLKIRRTGRTKKG